VCEKGDRVDPPEIAGSDERWAVGGGILEWPAPLIQTLGPPDATREEPTSDPATSRLWPGHARFD
jgi:hypothetical protein